MNYKPTRSKKSKPTLLPLLIIISLFVSFYVLSKQEAIIVPDDDSSSGDLDAAQFFTFYQSHQKNRSPLSSSPKMHLLGGVGDLEIVVFWTAVIIAIKLLFEENNLSNIYLRAPPLSFKLACL